jgi:hypothetical protein
MIGGGPYQSPKHCGECGKPFRWTETPIKAAEQFADGLDTVNASEKAELKATVPDLISDTPRTPLAVSRFKKLAAKIGAPAAQGFTQILISVLTEEAKRQLGLK